MRDISSTITKLDNVIHKLGTMPTIGLGEARGIQDALLELRTIEKELERHNIRIKREQRMKEAEKCV